MEDGTELYNLVYNNKIHDYTQDSREALRQYFMDTIPATGVINVVRNQIFNCRSFDPMTFDPMVQRPEIETRPQGRYSFKYG
jgi:hypothetical protein